MARLAGVHLSLLAHILQTALPSLIHRSYSRTHTTALHTLYAHVALSAWGVSFASRFEHRPRSLFSFFFRSIYLYCSKNPAFESGGSPGLCVWILYNCT